MKITTLPRPKSLSALTAIALLTSQIGIAATCPASDVIECSGAVVVGHGCATISPYCCQYYDWKCPGSSTLYRVYTPYFGWQCQRDINGQFLCQ